MEKTSTYIDNRIPLGHGKFMGVSPYQAIFKKKPPMSHLKPVGCAAVMKVESKKGEAKGVPVIFLGYEPVTGYYRVYDPIGRRIYGDLRDVRFDVNRMGKRVAARVLKLSPEDDEKLERVHWEKEEVSRESVVSGGGVGSQSHSVGAGDVEIEADREIEVYPRREGLPISGASRSQVVDVDTEVVAVESDSDMEIESVSPPATPPTPEPDGTLPSEENAVPPSDVLKVSHKGKNGKVRLANRPDPLVGARVEVPAREFGEEWARETYGEKWRTHVRTGRIVRPGGALKAISGSMESAHYVDFGRVNVREC